MIRSRFDELQKYLKTKFLQLGIRPEQFDCYVDKLTPTEGGHNETSQGFHLCSFRYTGLIYIERLSAVQLPLLALYVRSWLDDHDDTRSDYKLADPQFDVVPLDAKTLVDVMISCEFVDPVYLAPVDGDDPEAIDWNGKRYSVAEYLCDVAERGTVNDAPADGTM